MIFKAVPILALLLAAPVPAASVTVTVTGIKTNTGKVLVSLCTKRQFGASPCSYTISTPARTDGVTVTFNNVAPGRYMAAAFQDLDGNGELKFAIMQPTEPAGVSGPNTLIPDFEKAAFDIGPEAKTVSVTLK